MTFLDQLGRRIELPAAPRRIVSLVLSQTELLYDLGLEEQVVGITKFCIHPAHWFRTKPRVGGTKQLDLEKIRALAPDLILANKEENTQEQIEALGGEFPVWVSDISNLYEALSMINQIGELTDRKEKASAISQQIQSHFQTLQPTGALPKTCYLIWKDPYMSVGGDTFIHDMLCRGGFLNPFAHQSRYPPITVEQIRDAGCDVLLLSSEPYPFKQKHIEELQPLLPHTQILLVDGELFSWYGSRLLQSASYFSQLRRQIQPIH